MKTKILVGLILSTVVAGSLYANQGGMRGYDGFNDNGCKKSFFKKGFKRDTAHSMKRMMKELNLSYTQKKEIREIMQKQRESNKQDVSFFKNGQFDKSKFVKTMEDRRDNRLQNRADMMEKVYNVLNAEQKKEFVAMAEDKFNSRMMKF